MARIPTIYEQIFEAGDTITGVAYTGTAAPTQSADGYVYRQTKDPADGVIDGGLIPSVATGNIAYRVVTTAYIFADDANDIKIIGVDPDGFEHILYSTTSGDCLVVPIQAKYPIYPGWTVKVEVLTSNPGEVLGAAGGKIILVLDPWFQPAGFNFS
jgi:hypothetical protein